MKTCAKCGAVKSLDEFNKGQGRMGKRSDCRECQRKYFKGYSKGKPTRAFKWKPKYGATQRLNNARGVRARNLLYKGLLRGKLTKSDACWHCGSNEKIDGHHPDYDQPLSVVWLCRPCYIQTHNIGV